MIGDTYIDWEFAKNACINVFIVDYGYVLFLEET